MDKITDIAAAREAAKTESQQQAVRDFEMFYACQRINEGASADWLRGYCEAITAPGESVDMVVRAVLTQHIATVSLVDSRDGAGV